MPKMNKNGILKRREKIPRQAKNKISVEEINMIQEVLLREKELKRKRSKKGFTSKINGIRKKVSIKEKQIKGDCELTKEDCELNAVNLTNLDLNQCQENSEINERLCEGKTEQENSSNKESSSNLKMSGLSHFMDLEERKDLLMSQDDDPLSINGPEPFDSINWVSIKQEVPDDVEVSKVIFTEIPLKAVEEPKEAFASLSLPPASPLLSPSPVDKNEIKCDKPSTAENNINHEGNTKSENNDVDDDDCWWNNDRSSDDKEDSDSDFGVNKDDAGCNVQIKQKKLLRKFSCDICNKKLSTKSTLQLHKKRKHQIPNIFKCELCVKIFDSHRDLVKHRREIHRGKDGRYTCSDCGVVRSNYSFFLNHLKTHYEDGRVLYHRNNDGSEDIIFTCNECDKTFSKEQDFHIHKNLIHSVEDYMNGGKLKQQEKNYVCHTCGKRFVFGCLLRDHINLHTGTKPYLCQVCGRSFSQKASLKQHARTHNSVRPFQCTVCTQGFFTKGDLKKHMRKHTGERPYVCEMCGDGFSQSSHLGVHRRSHTGERPFKCDVCSRGFTKKGDVVRHRRIHTGELPYLCQVCGKAFRQSTQCANHIKNHHPDALVTVSKNPTAVAQWTY